MKLEKAIQLVLNEAESSALGESSSEGSKVLEAVETLQAFYDETWSSFRKFFTLK